MEAAGGSRAWTRRVALGLGTVAAAEVLAAAALAVGVGWSWSDALDAFVVTNSVMGVAFGACGTILAWHRPRNPIGWLFIADGLGHATTAVMAPLAQALVDAGAAVGVQRLVVTAFNWSWPWSIGLFLPLALLLFPDGRLPTARWRPALVALVVTSPLFVLSAAASSEPLREGLPPGYLTLASYDRLGVLWVLAELRTVGAMAVAVAGLIVRYRRGGDARRRQLLWLLLAAVAMVTVTLPWAFVAGTPVVVLLAIPLVPAAVTVAVVRHQLLDIRLVVSRALAWVLLSVVVIAVYVGLVALLDRFVAAELGRSAVATVIVALVVAPVLPRLQRMVDRAMYGHRDNPARVASWVGEQLRADPSEGLTGVAAAIRRALRLPYAAVYGPEGILGADGSSSAGSLHRVALEYGGDTVGELHVGLRPGEHELSTPDRDVIALVAAPLAVAVHATRLTAEVQASRERIIAAREEERRRLRRDLHDGLGPTLTGVAFAADAAANFLERDHSRTRELLDSLRGNTRRAIADIRQIVEDLRPPALDELGLAGALRQRAEQMSLRRDGTSVRVQVDAEAVPSLPAAIEVAAYRIATEALTNVVRHSRASSAVLRLRCGTSLDIEVVDNGQAPNGPWQPGVGLQAMRERAAELGGWFEAGPSSVGGRVSVSLPLPAADQ